VSNPPLPPGYRGAPPPPVPAQPYVQHQHSPHPQGTQPYGPQPQGGQPYNPQPYGPQPQGPQPYNPQPYGPGQAPYGQAAAAPAGPVPAAPGQPAVIDIGSAESRRAGIAAALLILLAVGALALGLVEAANGRMNGATIGVLIFGGVLLIVGLIPIFRATRYFRPRRLIIEQAGIRWDDPKGKSWAVPWPELAAVSISLHEKAEAPDFTVSGVLAGAAVDKTLGKVVRVRLDLYPADAWVRSRHPEMAHLWEAYGLSGGYRQPLGSHANVVDQIGGALSRFQPGLYRGVQRTRGVLGRY